jgi:hypothetical protein
MNVIIYQDQDGLAVIHPAEGSTMEQLVAAVPPGANYIALPLAELPEDRYFRDAWELVGGALSINIEKAKEVQRNVWRKMREPKLKALDLAFMRALEANDEEEQFSVTLAKTQLRDVTETVLPNDLDGIRNTIPTILI